MNFRVWLEASQLSQIAQLGFGGSVVVDTRAANQYAKHWGLSAPVGIGESVIMRPANKYQGSIVMTKVEKGKYLIKHRNDPLDPDYAKREIPYEGSGERKPPAGWPAQVPWK